MDLLWFLVIVIVVVILASVIWQAFGVNALFAGLTSGQRMLVALLGLLLIVILVWWAISSHLVHLP